MYPWNKPLPPSLASLEDIKKLRRTPDHKLPDRINFHLPNAGNDVAVDPVTGKLTSSTDHLSFFIHGCNKKEDLKGKAEAITGEHAFTAADWALLDLKGKEDFYAIIGAEVEMKSSRNKPISNKLVAQITPAAEEMHFVQPNYPNSIRGFDVPDTSAVPMLPEPNPVSLGAANGTRQSIVVQQDNLNLN